MNCGQPLLESEPHNPRFDVYPNPDEESHCDMVKMTPHIALAFQVNGLLNKGALTAHDVDGWCLSASMTIDAERSLLMARNRNTDTDVH